MGLKSAFLQPIEQAFDETESESAKETTFILKSSGRQVRKLESGESDDPFLHDIHAKLLPL